MSSGQQRERGKLFNEVPALYEQVREGVPAESDTVLRLMVVVTVQVLRLR